MYTQRELDAEVARGQAAMRAAPSRRTDGEIEFRRSIPEKLYWNAVRGHGVDPNDEEYWRDMERLNPWIVHKQAGKIRVAFGEGSTTGAAPRNRFGRVKERIYYR